MAVAAHHKLASRELLESHWAAGMELLRGNTDLSAKAELFTVNEAG